MLVPPVQIPLASPEETAALAVRLGGVLRIGDALLLSGGIGAGKTHFARALIQSLLAHSEDVPSPTFTLVQEYEGVNGPIWHCDLYRLSGPDDIYELGLDEAFRDAICIIEWPDRLGPLAPETALSLSFTDANKDDSRDLTLEWRDPSWTARLEKVLK
ncbi:tRNA (adenosine(37)-N6)-threonylcarbamoyltransferase complex ATPase subunit type 1 TsaE [Rhodalgimonas zhirmunskyi]|uniref:tRNA threonylcarbamoyladenosine biosynthesis protein TsaE n=1 Tax=Rhodalgimonas zhirmunskyi TaxID=2964767 RepID=A0AAJ1U663_9RHOB|nr:tRNA (adenosine(37)-N6)-threonylcarbamoyltransferase complex ATPase subunit type 1 TsaE [Rhodoalgimonas zhirmunskyi]MDQ2094330.1 tRNA (adenosine(37)-N6)-threonylcarbamoyltransferase complex ATPase subunit type 1 TsaE [Rhodoalgimonas zhirmunskyi]